MSLFFLNFKNIAIPIILIACDLLLSVEEFCYPSPKILIRFSQNLLGTVILNKKNLPKFAIWSKLIESNDLTEMAKASQKVWVWLAHQRFFTNLYVVISTISDVESWNFLRFSNKYFYVIYKSENYYFGFFLNFFCKIFASWETGCW